MQECRISSLRVLRSGSLMSLGVPRMIRRQTGDLMIEPNQPSEKKVKEGGSWLRNKRIVEELIGYVVQRKEIIPRLIWVKLMFDVGVCRLFSCVSICLRM